jgi:hypothetical protein
METCTTCFVTTQFPGVDIDETGQCRRCRSVVVGKITKQNDEIKYSELKALADTIKRKRSGKYDCIIGVSGGLDSSYMAYIASKMMGLNALLVHYDHGFYYDRPKENLKALAEDLGLELRIYRSKKAWDKKFVQAIMKAFEESKFYWGICTFCHYILPAVIVKVGMAESIKYFISHNNKYELSLNVPKQVKRDAMLKSVFGSPLKHLPKTLFYLILANYYLFRLKFEFFVPPIKNIFRGAPKKPFKTINLTKYVPWDIKKMIEDLARDTGWRLPDHPNLGMRFDCMIEDSLVDLSYKKATGLSIHGIIANNLIYDSVNDKKDLNHIVAYYEKNIDNCVDRIAKRAFDE